MMTLCREKYVVVSDNLWNPEILGYCYGESGRLGLCCLGHQGGVVATVVREEGKRRQENTSPKEIQIKNKVGPLRHRKGGQPL